MPAFRLSSPNVTPLDGALDGAFADCFAFVCPSVGKLALLIVCTLRFVASPQFTVIAQTAFLAFDATTCFRKILGITAVEILFFHGLCISESGNDLAPLVCLFLR